MAIRLTIKGRDGSISRILKGKTDDAYRKLETRVGQAIIDMAADIKEQGDADIQAGGNFGDRWTNGFHADVSGAGFKSKVTVSHDVPYWRIFQYGGVIHGKPLLWIPIPGTDAVGIRAKDYPGGLFHVVRKEDGMELLGSIAASQQGKTRRVRATGKGSRGRTLTGRLKTQVVDNIMRYVGKTSVTQKKRFHLIEIATGALAKFNSYLRNA